MTALREVLVSDVPSHDLRRNTTAIGQLVAVPMCPLTDGSGLLLAARISCRAAADGCWTSTLRPTAGPLVRWLEVGQAVAKLRTVLGAKVDLVHHNVEREVDGLDILAAVPS